MSTTKSTTRLLALAALIGGLYAIYGCANPAREQAQADAHAGVDALGGDPVITHGVHLNIETATGDERSELPPPNATPDEIASQPQQYLEQAEQTKKDASSFWLWGALGAAATTALGILKFVPGAHTPLVNLADRVLSSAKDVKQKKLDENIKNWGRDALNVADMYWDEDDIPPHFRPVLEAYRKHVTEAPTDA